MIIVIETLLLIVFGIGWILAIRKTSPSEVKELMAENKRLHQQLKQSIDKIENLIKLQQQQMKEVNTTLLLSGANYSIHNELQHRAMEENIENITEEL